MDSPLDIPKRTGRMAKNPYVNMNVGEMVIVKIKKNTREIAFATAHRKGFKLATRLTEDRKHLRIWRVK